MQRNQIKKRVGIVTDSAVCLPREYIERYHIRMVPEILIFEDAVYRDRIDIQPREFFTKLEQCHYLPTTSAPSPSDFLEVFQEAEQEADAIVCILVTSQFSSMGMKSAHEARSSLPEIPVEIFDSRTAVGAYGFIVLEAARAADEGKTVTEVIRAATAMRNRVNMVATLNTMEYLARGGRIGKAAHWAGSLLNIKPVISVPTSTGILEPVARIRTRKKALEKLPEIIERTIGPGKTIHASIDHANVDSDAERLAFDLRRRFNCVELFMNDWAPVAGVHCGPGVIGISYYMEE